MSLLTELKRRNVFRVAVAYTVIAWVLAQVADLDLSQLAVEALQDVLEEVVGERPHRGVSCQLAVDLGRLVHPDDNGEAALSVLIVTGAAFTFIGSLGLVRLSDFYTRLHGPTKATTLGVGSVVIASMIAVGGLGQIVGPGGTVAADETKRGRAAERQHGHPQGGKNHHGDNQTDQDAPARGSIWEYRFHF